MLAKGVTFFSSNTIALNVFFDFMFSTVIKSPFCPDANAIPYVVIDNLLLPKKLTQYHFYLHLVEILHAVALELCLWLDYW